MGEFLKVSREMVEAVAALHLPVGSDRRLRVLMDRNTNGALTTDDREELEAGAELSGTISLVRADVLHLPGRRP